MTTVSTNPGPESTQAAGRILELLGQAADCLEQMQDVMTGLTRALSAGTAGDERNSGKPPAPDHRELRVEKAAGGRALTRREQRVLTLVAAGLSNREVAWAMGISDKTAKNYVHALFLKLGVTSRTKAAFTALSEGLVDPGECERAGGEISGEAGPVPVRRSGRGGGVARLLTRSSAALSESAPFVDAEPAHGGDHR